MVRPGVCHLCGLDLRTAWNLRQHMRIHTGEKPFACDLCEYKAKRSYHLTCHKIKKHGILSGTHNAQQFRVDSSGNLVVNGAEKFQESH